MARRPAGYFVREYGQELAVVNTRTQSILLVLLLVLLYVCPLFLGRTWISWLTSTSIFLIAALGLNITTGYTGQISIGQAAFMGFGAFAGAAMANHFDWPFLACLLFAGLMGAIIATVFSVACFRLKGFYLALVTLAAHVFLPFVVLHLPRWTGGVDGLSLPLPSIGGLVFDTSQKWFYVVLTVAVLAVFAAKNLQRTRIGRAFIAIRDNDRAASAVGINVTMYKMLAFFVGAFFAGVAGYLLVSGYAHCDLAYFGFLDSIWLLGMLIVGGMGTTTGTIFGTLLLRLIYFGTNQLAPSLVSAVPFLPFRVASGALYILYGLVIIAFLVFEPRGMNHLWERFKNWYRYWPLSHAA